MMSTKIQRQECASEIVRRPWIYSRALPTSLCSKIRASDLPLRSPLCEGRSTGIQSAFREAHPRTLIYPIEDSVCPSPSPYIGDGGEHYMSALPFSVCPLAPSRITRYRGLCTVRSERVRSRHPHPNYSPPILGSASTPTSSIRSRREEPLPPLGTHSSPPL